jgi:hypothetical protein
MSLRAALKRANRVERSVMSTAHACCAKRAAPTSAAMPVPEQRSSMSPHGVRGINAMKRCVASPIAGKTMSAGARQSLTGPASP